MLFPVFLKKVVFVVSVKEKPLILPFFSKKFYNIDHGHSKMAQVKYKAIADVRSIIL